MLSLLEDEVNQWFAVSRAGPAGDD